MRPSLLLFLLLSPACQENKVGVFRTPPAVSIIAPADGAQVNPGTLVELIGSAQDQQTDAVDLLVSWESNLDGELGIEPPDREGSIYLAVNTLMSGSHVVTLTVVDADAESASTSIALEVAAGSTGEGAPTVVLLGPTEGQTFSAADVVNLVAAVTDGEDAYDTIACEIVDVPDGSIWTGFPTATGSLTVPMDLSVGVHQLTLNAVDADGNTATATVGLEILEDGRPQVAITAPLDGAAADTDVLISFQGTVSDDQTDVELLGVTWSSDVVGVLSVNPADSSGATSIGTALPAGIHTITLTAVDGEGKTGSDSIVLTVTDPLDRDDDGDGWTENEGDCDDDDPTVSPGASDVCDEVDNDCSGAVNESWYDGYERNETISAPYDCGEVDASLGWSNSTLSLSGLTFSDPTDEDWFTWNADDEWYDNITITIAVTGLPAAGTYVAELHDESGVIVASDSGPTSLTISYEGDVFETDEDVWTLRIYALTWPARSCSTAYTLRVAS